MPKLLALTTALCVLLVACGGEEELPSGVVGGKGMEPALVEGDFFQYEQRDEVRVGDIVVFEVTQDGVQRMFIKRVVALGGQTVEVADGVVLVDGAPLDESGYETAPPAYTVPPTEVPAGHVYVLGDNRADSIDSHDFGPVALDAVHGVVVEEGN